jgi:uncharacterized damage-inducible protein DinB
VQAGGGDMKMNEIERITDQFSIAFEGDAWTGPSIMEVLGDIEPAKAASKPIPNAHSIWEIAEHMNSTIKNVIKRIRGDKTPLTDEEDWPKVTDTGKRSWDELIARLKATHNELLSEIAKLKSEQINEPVYEGYSTYYVTLHGLVQHNQYHLGQISILKKGYFSTEGMLSH